MKNRNKLKMNEVLLFVMVMLFTSNGFTQTDIFWGTFSNTVGRVALDGSNLMTIHPSDAGASIATDITNEKLYYESGLTIKRCDFDGSNSELIITLTSGLGGIAIDETNGKVYWTEFGNNRVMRSDLDGSNIESIITGIGSPSGITVDPANNKLYVITYNTTAVYRADLDGANFSSIITGISGQGVGIDVDGANNFIYYTNRSASIYRAETNGSNVMAVHTGTGFIQGLDLHLVDGKMYWGDGATASINRADLDGSNVEVVTTSASGAWHIALGLGTIPNTAPVITSSDAVSVEENQTATLTVTATDADAGDTQTYSISGGADELLFDIDASTGVLTFATAPDFETPTDDGNNNTYIVEVTVTDNGSLTDVQTVTVTVINVSEFTDNAPVITSADAVSVEENQTATLTVTATDADAGDTQTYSISGGVDELLFDIDASTGVLTFATAPDFETPTDINFDNDYVVEVTVTDDGSLTDVQTITVTVTDEESLNVEMLNSLDILELYPNPSIGVYQLQFGQELIDSEVSIIDIKGKVIYQNTISETIDISSNVPGVYFMTITNQASVLRYKLVIKK